MYQNSTKSLANLRKQQQFEYITSGRLYKLRSILEDEECDVDINCFDENGLTPLMLACSFDEDRAKTRDQIIRILLKKGADPNISDHKGMTVLATACKEEHIEIVKLLLKTAVVDIDFNARDHHGDMPLMHAVRTGNVSLVRMLVDIMKRLTIDVDCRNNDDVTPYLEAKMRGLDAVAEVLRVDGNASDSIMICPLLFEDYTGDACDLNAKVHRVPQTVLNYPKQKANTGNRNNNGKMISTGQNPLHSFDARLRPNRGNDKCRSSGGRKGPTRRKSSESNFAFEVTKRRDRKYSKTRSVTSDLRLSDVSKTDTEDGSNFRKNKQKGSAIKETIHKTNLTVTQEKHQQTVKSDDIDLERRLHNEARIVPHLNFVGKSQSQPVISIANQTQATEREDLVDDFHSLQEADLTNKSKAFVKQQSQKKSPNWKRTFNVNDSREEITIDSADQSCEESQEIELKRDLSVPTSLRRNTLIRNMAPGMLLRRPSSNLSVVFADAAKSPSSRPGSAYNPRESHNFQFIQRPSSTNSSTKPRISFEEVFELCPEMRVWNKREWYSDLRWMLALRAHQDCPTHLPPQPERTAQEEALSEGKHGSETSRASRKSSLHEARRPVLRKRNTVVTQASVKLVKDIR